MRIINGPARRILPVNAVGISFPHHWHFGRRNSFHQGINLRYMPKILALIVLLSLALPAEAGPIGENPA